jgi:hypothetical protein
MVPVAGVLDLDVHVRAGVSGPLPVKVVALEAKKRNRSVSIVRSGCLCCWPADRNAASDGAAVTAQPFLLCGDRRPDGAP